MGGFKEWADGWAEGEGGLAGLRNGRMGGWVDGWVKGLVVMYNYAGGKGGAYDYEAYEAK